MSEKCFDPSEIVRGIQQLLVSDKKKIGFLFGAGTSLVNVETLLSNVEEKIRIIGKGNGINQVFKMNKIILSWFRFGEIKIL